MNGVVVENERVDNRDAFCDYARAQRGVTAKSSLGRHSPDKFLDVYHNLLYLKPCQLKRLRMPKSKVTLTARAAALVHCIHIYHTTTLQS